MLQVIDKIEDSFNESNAIVYFTATWCQPCKLIKPQFARAGTIDKENKYYIVDVDNIDPEYLGIYNIMSVPQILILSYGDLVQKIEGRTSEEILEEVKNVHGR
jgi:thiol-disulfide isomerase/thioredoxin